MTNAPLPNLIIAGVVKAGTTSVFTYLSKHPDVCASSLKEAQYFTAYRYGEPPGPLENYRSLFARWRGEKYVMEATPGYFEGGAHVARKIREVVGDDVRILIILRDPVDRLLSFFRYKKSVLQLEQDVTLDEYLRRCRRLPATEARQRKNDVHWGIEGGLYANHLPGWFEEFGDSMRVMFFDQLNRDRLGFMKELCEWLDIDAAIYERLSMDIENRSRNYRSKTLQNVALRVNDRLEAVFRRWPGIKRPLRDLYYRINSSRFGGDTPKSTLIELREFYEPYNRELRDILDRKGYHELPDWLGGPRGKDS
ncbi:MAG: sulfotransferase domain-containing protein [Gammaproteobacteria bacterium]|nr:sulfotransferase domain-containing protein [Gammaproteobacteria bacterium]